MSIDSLLTYPVVALLEEDKVKKWTSLILNNNLNILAQNGLFLVNTYPKLPLEEAIKSFLNEKMETIDYNGFKRKQIEEEAQIILCVEVKKSLNSEIGEWLKLNKVSKQSIFPNPRLIADKAVEKFKNEHL